MQNEPLAPPARRRSLPLRSSALFLSVLALVSCGGGDLVLPNETGPASVSASAGDGQSGTVGGALTDPIVLKVVDRQGQPVTGVRVTFAPDAAAGGSVDPASVVTGNDGLAAAQWVLGNTAGSQTATAQVAGVASLSESFTATAAPGPAQTLALVSGDNQSAPAGGPLPEPLVVMVTDQFANPVPNVEVKWDAKGGSADPATSTTGADGHASTSRVLGSGAGTQQTTVTSKGLDGSPITFTHIATAGSASDLVLVSGDNQTGDPGAQLADPLVVRLTDGDGNPISGSAVSWIVGSGGGSINPGGNTDADGLASAMLTLGPTRAPTPPPPSSRAWAWSRSPRPPAVEAVAGVAAVEAEPGRARRTRPSPRRPHPFRRARELRRSP